MHDDVQIESLLFTDENGDRSSFQDVVDDGLDGVYADRVVPLTEIAHSSAPILPRALAVALLVAWGEEVGYTTAIAWLDEHAALDGGTDSTGDSSFGDVLTVLVDGIQTSYWKEQTSILEELRESTLRRVLDLADQQWLSSDIGLTIARASRDTRALESDLKTVIGRCLTVLARGHDLEFDLPMQTAALILPLSRVDDSSAASFARALLNTSSRELVARELVESLRGGTGTATAGVLRELANSRSERVAVAAAAALSRRAEEGTPAPCLD